MDQTVIEKNLRVKFKEGLRELRLLLGSPEQLRITLRRRWYVLVLVVVLGLVVQFMLIPASHLVLEKLYPPIKEKRLFGLYEKTTQDEHLASRETQASVAWWLLFTGGMCAGLILAAPRLSAEASAAAATAPAPAGGASNEGQRYTLREEIGRGAMGIVYAAHDNVLQREVAVKELPHYLMSDPERRERFRREALTLAKLSHKGIVNIYDLIEDHERLLLVMELVEDGSLDTLLAPRIPMPAADAVKLITEIAEALGYIHAQGVIHRDLKPANVLIDAFGHAKLADFGLARLCQDSSLTVDGSVIGSPLYMSPEQAVGRKSDQRSDIYALGALFYTLLTGAPPFEGDPQEVISMHLMSSPVPPTERADNIPEALNALVMQMLSKLPEERPENCAAFLAALEKCA